MGMTETLTLFVKEGCHLCEDLLHDLKGFDEFQSLEITLVDIDSDPLLKEKYAVDIPVLTYGSEVICKHFLNPVALREAVVRG